MCLTHIFKDIVRILHVGRFLFSGDVRIGLICSGVLLVMERRRTLLQPSPPAWHSSGRRKEEEESSVFIACFKGGCLKLCRGWGAK